MIGIFTSAMVTFLKLLFHTGSLTLTAMCNDCIFDDWDLNFNQITTIPIYSVSHFGRAIVMPNLKPPITTTAAAVAYRESILKALPTNSNFTPLMTLYLTDTTSPDEIKLASKSNLHSAIDGAHYI